ncbi:SDR family oxidoreductase [Seongchinamella unica]|uniref:SDR family oxidoreductase n=1 Tax=Seongchinamella unica TaxID=2547392 RepID=A0A4R5LSI9_9GAMM|nr:SDR family NAD(P)-dependent oxidoreductase [Seongchinamella unica]TDG13883.1 SDR family oxidoreductase [Seongchinamella unica]
MTQTIEQRFSLQGKVALVTGASSGLGARFAVALADAGATVVAAARRKEKLQALVQQISDAGGRALAVAMDVTSAASVTSALDEAERGAGPVDILVNNAGVAGSRHCLKEDEANWDAIMETNLKGAWRVAHGVAKRSVAAGRPCSIINIASILGVRVGFGESSYAISKAAVVQMTKAMALELARKNIRVNAICPGYFATEMNADYLLSEGGQAYLKDTTAGRMGELDELDGPLLLLASDAGSFINGAIIPVDGGHLVGSL